MARPAPFLIAVVAGLAVLASTPPFVCASRTFLWPDPTISWLRGKIHRAGWCTCHPKELVITKANFKTTVALNSAAQTLVILFFNQQ